MLSKRAVLRDFHGLKFYRISEIMKILLNKSPASMEFLISSCLFSFLYPEYFLQ